MKGAWVMHTLRSVINNDKIWFEILKGLWLKTQKALLIQMTFLIRLMRKLNKTIGILLSNILFSHQPELDYYQTDQTFHFRWSNVNDNFIMPIELLVNGAVKRVNPSNEFQSFNISKILK